MAGSGDEVVGKAAGVGGDRGFTEVSAALRVHRVRGSNIAVEWLRADVCPPSDPLSHSPLPSSSSPFPRPPAGSPRIQSHAAGTVPHRTDSLAGYSRLIVPPNTQQR